MRDDCTAGQSNNSSQKAVVCDDGVGPAGPGGWTVEMVPQDACPHDPRPSGLHEQATGPKQTTPLAPPAAAPRGRGCRVGLKSSEESYNIE